MKRKEKKSGSYNGPRDGKLPLRMPPEGEKLGIEVENSPTEINKGAQYVGKIKPYTTTIRRLVS